MSNQIDRVESYVVNENGIVEDTYSGLSDALGNGYRVVDVSKLGIAAGNGFMVVTVVLTKDGAASRFTSKGQEVGKG